MAPRLTQSQRHQRDRIALEMVILAAESRNLRMAQQLLVRDAEISYQFRQSEYDLQEAEIRRDL